MKPWKNFYRCSVHSEFIQFTHQQMHYLLNLERFKFTLKYKQMLLLHVSVYDHHQRACTEPG